MESRRCCSPPAAPPPLATLPASEVSDPDGVTPCVHGGRSLHSLRSGELPHSCRALFRCRQAGGPAMAGLQAGQCACHDWRRQSNSRPPTFPPLRLTVPRLVVLVDLQGWHCRQEWGEKMAKELPPPSSRSPSGRRSGCGPRRPGARGGDERGERAPATPDPGPLTTPPLGRSCPGVLRNQLRSLGTSFSQPSRTLDETSACFSDATLTKGLQHQHFRVGHRLGSWPKQGV